jgi:hypothetical protein
MSALLQCIYGNIWLPTSGLDSSILVATAADLGLLNWMDPQLQQAAATAAAAAATRISYKQAANMLFVLVIINRSSDFAPCYEGRYAHQKLLKAPGRPLCFICRWRCSTHNV